MHARRLSLFMLAAAAISLCACRSSSVLVFGQSHTVGISIGTAPSQSTPELSVGYKDLDIAVVPVAILSNDGAVTKDTMRVNSAVASIDRADGFDTDALSVLGQFEVSTKAKEPEVGLGKFFATGLAAQKLADGFSCKLSALDKCPQESTRQRKSQPQKTSDPQTPPPTAAR